MKRYVGRRFDLETAELRVRHHKPLLFDRIESARCSSHCGQRLKPTELARCAPPVGFSDRFAVELSERVQVPCTQAHEGGCRVAHDNCILWQHELVRVVSHGELVFATQQVECVARSELLHRPKRCNTRPRDRILCALSMLCGHAANPLGTRNVPDFPVGICRSHVEVEHGCSPSLFVCDDGRSLRAWQAQPHAHHCLEKQGFSAFDVLGKGRSPAEELVGICRVHSRCHRDGDTRINVSAQRSQPWWQLD
eukprot:7380606-Prymnesium_polylepis.3